MLFRSLRVRDLMTVDVESVAYDAKPSVVHALLRRRAYHHLPVVNAGKLVGILSTVDLALVSLGGYVDDADTVDAHLDRSFSLTDIISTDVVTCRADDTALVAAERLAGGAFHALPVLDGSDHLIGIITSTDLVRWLATQG